MSTVLIESFQSKFSQTDFVGASSLQSMSKRLDGIIQECQASYPEIHFSAQDFASYLGECFAQKGSLDALDDFDYNELFLTKACAIGDRAALRTFDDAYIKPACGALRRMKMSEADIDDVVQRVREKLMWPQDNRIRLEDYAGKGDLRGFLRVVLVREALSLLRKKRPHDEADFDALADAQDDPELQFIKRKYRGEFKRSFAQASSQLTSRQRNLLRLHLVEKVTLEDLAKYYSVNRSSVVRWLKKARQALLTLTKNDLKQRLEIDSDEFEAMFSLIQSRLDISIHRLLSSRS